MLPKLNFHLPKLRINITSIRFRIVLLSLLGIVGMLLIAGLNRYLDASKTREMAVGIQSQEIARYTLQNMILEEQFVRSNQEKVPDEYIKLQDVIRKISINIKQKAEQSAIKKFARDILKLSRERQQIFNKVVANKASMKEHQVNILANVQKFSMLLDRAVTKIDREERRLVKKGKLLSAIRGKSRVQIKDFIIIWGEKLMNIQKLFSQADADRYGKQKKKLDARLAAKIKDIQTTVRESNDDESNEFWRLIFGYVPVIEKIENSVFSEWQENQDLIRNLSDIGMQTKETALSIVKQTKKNIARAEKMSNMISTGVALAGILFLGLSSWLIIRSIITPIDRTVSFATSLKEGDLAVKLPVGKDEIGIMNQALNAVVDEMNAKAEVARHIADGDLRQQVNIASEKDSLGHSLQTMISSLNTIVSGLYSASQRVDAGSSQVSDSSQSLSKGAIEQASSLEEITSSMTEISSQTRQNAENSKQANQLAIESRNACQNGVEQMKEMMAAIRSISDSSQEINKIIKTIDDIAFQTNLLALNAAVEAARAGKHGKGFAVVAQEVRTLAARSAKAAQETAELIEGSVKRVDAGNAIAQKTADALTMINEGVGKVTDLVKEIAVASDEQANGVAQINQGLSQIDAVTQQNSANAEETSSAAEDLSYQAGQVRNQLGRFKIQKQVGSA